MDEKILSALRKWKKRQFFDKQVQLANIARPIRDGTEPFKMISINPKRWMCMRKDTGLPVVFTYPVCWNSNMDLQSGNFMPSDEEETGNFRAVKEISPWLSKIAYYFDVTLDDGFLKHIKALEDYIQRDENFNLSGKRRKEWQNGQVSNGRYQVEHKLFVHSGSKYIQVPDEELGGVHPWLVTAIRSQLPPKKFNLNVPFPSCVNYTENEGTTSILEDDPATFSKGDIVVMNFRLGFILGENEWWPEILPDEFVRVEKANRNEAQRYANNNWPGRDPTVQRLAIKRIPSVWPSTGLERRDHIDDAQPNENNQDDDNTASETDEDTLSQHSTESIKRRIGNLAVEEEMVIVDAPVDQDQDMEVADEEIARPKARKKGTRK